MGDFEPKDYKLIKQFFTTETGEKVLKALESIEQDELTRAEGESRTEIICQHVLAARGVRTSIDYIRRTVAVADRKIEEARKGKS